MSDTVAPRLLIDGEGGRVLCTEGTRTLAGAIELSGVALDMRCGGQGLCHGCEVEVDGVVVQACQRGAEGARTVRVPGRSILRRDAWTADEFVVQIGLGEWPLGRAHEDDPRREPLALAIDVGTTTVAALLIDRTSGAAIARAGDLNQQSTFGDNVLARIQQAMNDRGAVGAMQRAVLDGTIGPLVRQMLTVSGRSADEIAVVAVAGNSTMLHLLVGEDPSSLGVAPFRAVFLGHRVQACGPAWAGVEGLAPDLHLLPGVSAYIGADILAGVDAVDLGGLPGPALFLDIGTNGELVLFDGKRLTACATAAGPAFEGVGLSCGVRASRRAISEICVCDGPPRIIGSTLGAGVMDPVGVCGTGYVDFLATGRAAGLLDLWGRISARGRERWGESLSASRRSGARVLIAPEHGVWTDARRATVTERDIATVLQAKAAIRAGIEVLLERAGVGAGELEAVFIAGGFGTRLNAGNAVTIGLLPTINPHRVVALGNTSLAGAVAAVLDANRIERLSKLAPRIEPHVLGHEDGFEERFIDAMRLP